MVGKKDGDVVVPSSVDEASVVVALPSVDVASDDVAVASVVVVLGSAATNEPNATELNKPTNTNTATAAARRVFFSNECPFFTMILSLNMSARRRTPPRVGAPAVAPIPFLQETSVSSTPDRRNTTKLVSQEKRNLVAPEWKMGNFPYSPCPSVLPRLTLQTRR